MDKADPTKQGKDLYYQKEPIGDFYKEAEGDWGTHFMSVLVAFGLVGVNSCAMRKDCSTEEPMIHTVLGKVQTSS